MPTGAVVWFDDKSGEGIIRRDGREYPVLRTDIEPVARVPSAPVHFDISREEGVQRAVNVILRRGRRVGPRQHRFGDLAGARHPDEKGHHPLSRDHPGTDWAYEGHPLTLIKEWVGLVTRQELATARLLYAPDAVLQIGSERVMGRDAIVDLLWDELPRLLGWSTETREDDGVITVKVTVRKRRRDIRFVVEHGRIVEQQM